MDETYYRSLSHEQLVSMCAQLAATNLNDTEKRRQELINRYGWKEVSHVVTGLHEVVELFAIQCAYEVC